VHPFPIPAGRQDRSRLRLELRAPLPPAARARACEHVRMLLSTGGVRLVVCDVHGAVDLQVVDLLARLALTARRRQARVLVRSDSDDLTALLRLTGLDRQLESG
jgi:hypothetical protein